MHFCFVFALCIPGTIEARDLGGRSVQFYFSCSARTCICPPLSHSPHQFSFLLMRQSHALAPSCSRNFQYIRPRAHVPFLPHAHSPPRALSPPYLSSSHSFPPLSLSHSLTISRTHTLIDTHSRTHSFPYPYVYRNTSIHTLSHTHAHAHTHPHSHPHTHT